MKLNAKQRLIAADEKQLDAGACIKAKRLLREASTLVNKEKFAANRRGEGQTYARLRIIEESIDNAFSDLDDLLK